MMQQPNAPLRAIDLYKKLSKKGKIILGTFSIICIILILVVLGLCVWGAITIFNRKSRVKTWTDYNNLTWPNVSLDATMHSGSNATGAANLDACKSMINNPTFKISGNAITYTQNPNSTGVNCWVVQPGFNLVNGKYYVPTATSAGFTSSTYD